VPPRVAGYQSAAIDGTGCMSVELLGFAEWLLHLRSVRSLGAKFFSVYAAQVGRITTPKERQHYRIGFVLVARTFNGMRFPANPTLNMLRNGRCRLQFSI
jgi:hypothetical protein